MPRARYSPFMAYLEGTKHGRVQRSPNQQYHSFIPSAPERCDKDTSCKTFLNPLDIGQTGLIKSNIVNILETSVHKKRMHAVHN